MVAVDYGTLARRSAMKHKAFLKRTSVRKKRPGPPRRGRVHDLNFLAYMAEQPCLVSGQTRDIRGRRVELHHVRQYGSQKNDRRVLPLLPQFHRSGEGVYSIETLGKLKFQQRYGIDIEGAIARYNSEYEAQKQ